MAAPDYEVIFAAVGAMRADATLRGYLQGADGYFRFYDPPPAGETSVETPYISLGPTNSFRDDADCIDASEISFQLDIWDKGGSSKRCRDICDAIVRLLHNAELTLTTNALASLELGLSQILRDPDNIHIHGVLRFDAVVEQP